MNYWGRLKKMNELFKYQLPRISLVMDCLITVYFENRNLSVYDI